MGKDAIPMHRVRFVNHVRYSLGVRPSRQRTAGHFQPMMPPATPTLHHPGWIISIEHSDDPDGRSNPARRPVFTIPQIITLSQILFI